MAVVIMMIGGFTLFIIGTHINQQLFFNLVPATTFPVWVRVRLIRVPVVSRFGAGRRLRGSAAPLHGRHPRDDVRRAGQHDVRLPARRRLPHLPRPRRRLPVVRDPGKNPGGLRVVLVRQSGETQGPRETYCHRQQASKF